MKDNQDTPQDVKAPEATADLAKEELTPEALEAIAGGLGRTLVRRTALKKSLSRT